MNDIKIIENKIREAERVVIYGAGAVSNIVYLYMEQKKLSDKVVCFAVSSRNGNSEYKNGVPVKIAEDILLDDCHMLVLIAVQISTQQEIVNKLAELKCTNYLIIEPDLVINFFYQSLYKEPIVRNKLFFMNYNGGGYGCNPKYIAEELIRQYREKDLELVWGIGDNAHTLPANIKTVRIGTYEYYREIATAHIWIDNARKQIDIRKRKGQFYIQTWHGAAPMKKVEGDLEGKVPQSLIDASKRDSEMADLFLSGSKFYSHLYRKSFWYKGEIMEAGLPRQDVFWNIEPVQKKVKDFYGIKEEQWVVLYAPTFRDDYHKDAYDLDILMVKDAVERKFHCHCVVCVSKHPNNRNIQYQFADGTYIDVSNYADFEELLAAADILITDFSGCAYDYSFTQRPVFLYQKDFEKLKTQRDFYVPMEEVPFLQARSNQQMVENILKFNPVSYKKKLEKYMGQFGNFDDGCASRRVCERIMEIINAENET